MAYPTHPERTGAARCRTGGQACLRLSLAYLMKVMASEAITMKIVQKSQPGRQDHASLLS